MELLLGSHVREHGSRIGRLAGFEVNPSTRRLSQIIFSETGTLDSGAKLRPVVTIGHVHENGEVELRSDIDAANPEASAIVVLAATTRLKQGNRDIGHLTGVEVNAADNELVSLFGRSHWWSRKSALDAFGLDCSTPGEVRGSAPR